MRQDRTGCEVPIEYAHHRVHNEELFSLSMTAIIGAAATIAMHIISGAIKKVHIDFSVSTNIGGTLVFREDDTLTAGTPRTPINNNRNSSQAAVTTFLQDATVGAAGTVLRTIIVGGGTGVLRVGAESRQGAEFILKPSMKYTLIFTSGGATNSVALNADFYEE